MKVAFIFLAVFFVVVAKDLQYRNANEDDDAFENYKKTNNVKYKDQKEESERKNQYMKCRSLVR
jgi:hypothetical protein